MTDPSSPLCEALGLAADLVGGERLGAALVKLLPVLPEYLSGLDVQSRERLFRQSHETASHFKWLLGPVEAGQSRLWVHEYKAAASRRPGYATVAHDHRYPFVSLVVAGSYRNRRWELTGGGLLDIGSAVVSGGEVLISGSDDIHSLEEIKDGTISLFAEGPPARPFSTSYDVKTGASTQHYYFAERFSTIISKLQGVATG